MAKNATLAYPFDHMSGKLGTDQNLKYAEHDNPAWDAPDGRQYAKNYKPVMVLNYNAATDKQTFQIKTKSATFMSPATRLKMAISGGANAIIATIIALRLSATSALATIFTHFLNMQGEGIIPQDMTYRKYLTDVIYKGVRDKASVFTFGSPQGQVLVNNPWVDGGAGIDVQIQTATLTKFALYLCPIVFSVDGKKYGTPLKDMRELCLDSDDPLSGRDGKYANWYGVFKLKEGSPMLLEEDEILYNGSNIYKGSTMCMGDFELTNGDALSTTAPNA